MTAPNDPLASLTKALDRYNAMQTAAIEAAADSGAPTGQDGATMPNSEGDEVQDGISPPS